MFSQEEATVERINAYKAALEDEKAGYAQGLAEAKDGGDEKRVAKLEKRIKSVDSEIARVAKLKPGKVPAAA